MKMWIVSDAVYVATFHATGCPNTHPFTEWWRSQSEETVVLDDMNTYCELTRDALASDEQRIQCCGAGNCNVTECVKQYTLTKGIHMLNWLIVLNYLSLIFKLEFEFYCEIFLKPSRSAKKTGGLGQRWILHIFQTWQEAMWQGKSKANQKLCWRNEGQMH